MTRESRTFTETVTYNAFAPGERVRFSEWFREAERVWVVERFLPPLTAGDEATVFLEGRPYGINAALLVPAEEGEPCPK